MDKINVRVKLSWSPVTFNVLTALAFATFVTWLVTHGGFPWYLILVPFAVPVVIMSLMSALFVGWAFLFSLLGGKR